jgi:LPS-assembly protein
LHFTKALICQALCQAIAVQGGVVLPRLGVGLLSALFKFLKSVRLPRSTAAVALVWAAGLHLTGFSQNLKLDFGRADVLPAAAASMAMPVVNAPVDATHSAAAAQAAQVTFDLRSSPALIERLDPLLMQEAPVFLFANELRALADERATFAGDVEFRRAGMILKSEKLDYFQAQDRIVARGKVRLNQLGNVFDGRDLDLRVQKLEGVMHDTRYNILRTGGHGTAARLDFLGDKRLRAQKTTYTTCTPENVPGWLPAWILTANELLVDQNDDVGQAWDATIRFKDVPILSVPYLTFPLSDKRKSGFLPPLLNVDSVAGVEFGVPYYWDIAPNRDLTISPNLMSRRGLDLGGEFRYLEREHSGSIKAGWMPHDRLHVADDGTYAQRWSYASLHNFALDSPSLAGGRWSADLKINRVSDNDYWKDFPRAIGSLTQRLLPSDAGVAWQSSEASASLRLRRWQTLQDATAPIFPPYDKLPELLLRYPRLSWLGLDFGAEANYTRFLSDPSLTGQTNGSRAHLQSTMSKRYGDGGWFVTPKMSTHLTQYALDAPLANGQTSARRVVPSFSVDSGMFFDRDATLLGTAYRQTLEPRLMAVYTPYRNQSLLPNYDSAAKDFNLSSIYSENPYLGNDRIADAKLLTFGVTSRFLNDSSGAERFRLGVAQRLRFKDQNVTLPGQEAIQERVSDVLINGAWNWNAQLSSEQTVQYNPKASNFERAAANLRYKPGAYQSFNLSYYLQRDVSSQLDLSWQMPLDKAWDAARGWYSAGRFNYSLRDQRMVNAVLGLEYDGCCWVGRLAVEHLQTSTSSATSRLLLQLEFVGFSRVGFNALRALRDNVPRYQVIRERAESPSRFTQYD